MLFQYRYRVVAIRPVSPPAGLYLRSAAGGVILPNYPRKVDAQSLLLAASGR